MDESVSNNFCFYFDSRWTELNGAYDMLTMVISELYKEHLYLLDSDKISEYDKELARQLIQGVASANGYKKQLIIF